MLQSPLSIGLINIPKAPSTWICSRCSLRQSRPLYSPMPRSRYYSTPTESQRAQSHDANSSRAPESSLQLSKASNIHSSKKRKHKRAKSRSAINHGKRVLSLIQPTGIPHLGNYLGALRQWKDLQSETDPKLNALYFGLADLHSLTLKQDPNVRKNNVRQTYAALLAMGIDQSRCALFCQSHRPESLELMWILSNVASTGYLSRMTQWKEKAGLSGEKTLEDLQDAEGTDKSREKVKLGLFTYPVLQAADILTFNADKVPVGEDQAQHVEFTRQLARSFNATYCEEGKPPVFTIPNLLLSPAKRIMSLQDPSKKMSKSDADERSRILITDSPESVRDKIRSAKTDSVPGPITYDPEERPGVSNLITIFQHITRTQSTPEEIAKLYENTSLGAFKQLVAEAITKEFEGIGDKYKELMEPGNATIEDNMNLGAMKAGIRSGDIMGQVRTAVGMYSPKDVLDVRKARTAREGKLKDSGP